MKNHTELLQKDLVEILQRLQSRLGLFREKHFFLTGGTGLYGKWILEFFYFLSLHGLWQGNLHILSRSPNNFLDANPHFAKLKSFVWHQGTMISFHLPLVEIDFAIHGAATSASETFNNYSSIQKLDDNIKGANNFLSNMIRLRVPRLLLLSSGSVYGAINPKLTEGISEEENAAPLTSDLGSSLGHAKRIAEHLFFIRQSESNYEFNIARSFSLLGPFLPLDLHYAAGNFIRNALNQEPLRIRGDGSSIRSYIYPTDLLVWLFSILLLAPDREIFNVGSHEHLSILSLAQMINRCSGNTCGVKFENSLNDYSFSSQKLFYPNVSKARELLGLEIGVKLEQAIVRTLKFYQFGVQNSGQ